MKQCPKCKKKKFIRSFGIDKNRPDGHNVYCKECIRERDYVQYGTPKYNSKKRADRAKANARNRAYVYDILQRSKCIDCGDQRWQVLEFDHVRGDKVRAISDMVKSGMSIDNIESEIAKCDIRCANCHRLKTMTEENWHKNNYPCEK